MLLWRKELKHSLKYNWHELNINCILFSAAPNWIHNPHIDTEGLDCVNSRQICYPPVDLYHKLFSKLTLHVFSLVSPGSYPPRSHPPQCQHTQDFSDAFGTNVVLRAVSLTASYWCYHGCLPLVHPHSNLLEPPSEQPHNTIWNNVSAQKKIHWNETLALMHVVVTYYT